MNNVSFPSPMMFLPEYKDTLEVQKPTVDVVECDFTRPSGPGQICQVGAKGLLAEPCTKDSNYGYKEGHPCILLKLNKVNESRSKRGCTNFSSMEILPH